VFSGGKIHRCLNTRRERAVVCTDHNDCGGIVVQTIAGVLSIRALNKNLLLQVMNSGASVDAAIINTTVSEAAADLVTRQPMILGDSKLYQIIYSNVLYYPVMYVVPLGTLAVLNTRLISSLDATRRRTSLMPARAATKTTTSGQLQAQRRRRNDDSVFLPPLTNQHCLYRWSLTHYCH